MSIISLGLLYSSEVFPRDQYHLILQGIQARDKGNTELAIDLYEKYAASSPVASLNAGSKKINNKQYYVRNLLMAYENLYHLYKSNKYSSKMEEVNTTLYDMYTIGLLSSRNAYKVARHFAKEGHSAKAEEILRTIINDQANSPLPFNNKVTIRSYKLLFELLDASSKLSDIEDLAYTFTSSYPSAYCDLNDKHNIAVLSRKYARGASNSNRIHEEIIEEYINTSERADLPVALQSFAALMRTFHQEKDYSALQKLVDKTYTNKAFTSLPLEFEYKYGTTILKYTPTTQGVIILENIVSRAPSSIQARKALFALGRHAQAKENWDDAIKYFSSYIDQNPDIPFFSTKAYSKLLDSYFSRDGYTQFLESEMDKFASIVNNLSDYESILNFSRDLKWKGWDELAESTFKLGLTKANTRIGEAPEMIDELKVRWNIVKYAHAHGHTEIADKHGNKILTMTDAGVHTLTSKRERSKAKYIRGQIRLWLAKSSASNSQLAETESHLLNFISENPNDSDIDYAWFQLGRSYELNNRTEDALSSYRKAKHGIWQKKANQRIGELENGATH
jgi:tetratricopeptide (TPR) repeat protein